MFEDRILFFGMVCIPHVLFLLLEQSLGGPFCEWLGWHFTVGPTSQMVPDHSSQSRRFGKMVQSTLLQSQFSENVQLSKLADECAFPINCYGAAL